MEVSALKVRIRFSKSGALVYIGHLDVMRYFQKLFRRAGIPVAYSEGFSPHQILSFTPPLPLGMESDGEYADVEITESINSAEAINALIMQSVPEIEIHSFKALPERCENAMASVKAASYRISFTDGKNDRDLEAAVSSFNGRDAVYVVKKTKKNETTVNLRPLVYKLCADNKEGFIEMLISSGSTDNIKPELVLASLFDDEHDPSHKRSDVMIKRIDQYTLYDGKLVSLDDIGSIIK